jgi:alkaline phosphatase
MNEPFSRRGLLRMIGLGAVAAPVSIRPAQAASTPNRPRGIVFLVSDGMSPGVFSMAQNFSRLTREKDTAWWSFYNEPTSSLGLMDTASANSLVTDSAAASSAWGGGQRVNNGSINVTPSGKPITPIAAILKERNPNTRIGLVTTATVTHATPAGFAANVHQRGDEDKIAPQYLNRADIILGGGSVFFRKDKRKDQRDLLGEFTRAGYATPGNRKELLDSNSEKLLGTFTPKYLPFSIDHQNNEEMRKQIPTLEEMTRVALSRFLDSKAPFLLQIEGARIDHAAHLNDIGGLLHDQLAFDDALATVLRMTASHPDILVIATSDHGNSNPGLNGIGAAYTSTTKSFRKILDFKASFERIFEDWKKSSDKSPTLLQVMIQNHLDIALTDDESTAVIKAIDPGMATDWNHLHQNPEGILGQAIGNHCGIGWTGTTHTSDPTLITARGPGAERFQGLVINTDVFTHLTELLA